MAEQKLGSFEALKSSMLSNGIIYQAYISDQRLVAVKIGTPLEGGRGITMHFGLIGALIQYFLNKRVVKRRAALCAANETLSLDQLLQQDPKNFEVRYDSLEKAELKKSGMLKAGPAHLVLKPVAGDPVELSLQTKDTLAKAMPLLEAGLKGRLETDAKLRA